MRDDSIENLEVSKKHLPLRITLFVLAVVVAVAAFTYGVKKLGGNEPGYAAVSARADGDAPLYASDIRLTYHFDGGSRDIRVLKNEISDAYSGALGRLYKLLDARNEYPGYAGSLAELNRRVNREVTLPRELFDILREAMDLTQREEGYSVFAAPLYEEWERIAYAADAAEFDPLADPDEAERLQAIAAQCADPENRSLEIVDEAGCVVRLNVSQAYLDFLEAYELSGVVLDLGPMKNAWILRGVASALEQRGYSDGFLNTLGGLGLALSGSVEGEYVMYSYVNNTATLAATFPISSGTAGAAFTAFPVTEEAAGYYTAGGAARCAVRPAPDGAQATNASVFALRRDGDIVAACYASLCCFLSKEPASAASYGADLLFCVLTEGDGRTLYASGNAADQLQTEKGFSLMTAASP